MPAEPVKFPVDFEKLAKSPPPANGRGAPYQISGRDLMADYSAAALLVDDAAVSGLRLEETREANRRTVKLAGALEIGDTLPDGTAGDILYHDGDGWVVLPIGYDDQVLTSNGVLPAWENAAAASSTHPWKCTANGTSNIAVAAGKVMGMRTSLDMPYYLDFVSYAGASVAISAAGYLYAVVEVELQGIDGANQPDIGTVAGVSASGNYLVPHTHHPTSVSVQFSTEAPDVVNDGTGDQIWIPIAQIGYAASVATVADQILTHNPITSFETHRQG